MKAIYSFFSSCTGVEVFAGWRVSPTRVINTGIYDSNSFVKMNRSNISLCMLSFHSYGYFKCVPKLYISLV